MDIRGLIFPWSFLLFVPKTVAWKKSIKVHVVDVPACPPHRGKLITVKLQGFLKGAKMLYIFFRCYTLTGRTSRNFLQLQIIMPYLRLGSEILEVGPAICILLTSWMILMHAKT